MSKTPEEMAEEYANDWHKDSDYPPKILIHTKRATANVFLAGYKAAKDQLADADKVMCNTTMEEIKAVDTGEIIPITNLPTPAKWISVKDRLPESGVGWTMVYGCILSRWSVQPGFYDRQRKEWLSRFFNGYEDEEGYAPLEGVTHWQPLPAPPKEEK